MACICLCTNIVPWTCKFQFAHTHCLLWPLLLLVLTAPGLSCKRITQKSLSNQLSKGGKMKMRKCWPKSCSSSKKLKCFKLGRSHCIPVLMFLCMLGISNLTESQLYCLWFCSKSGQDTNHSYESFKVSYLNGLSLVLHKLFLSYKVWYSLKKILRKHTCLQKIPNQKTWFAQALSYIPNHNGNSTPSDLQDMSFLMPFQSLLFNHWASNHMY